MPNFLIVAIDTQLRDYLTEKGVNVYYKDIQVRSTNFSVLSHSSRFRVSSQDDVHCKLSKVPACHFPRMHPLRCRDAVKVAVPVTSSSLTNEHPCRV